MLEGICGKIAPGMCRLSAGGEIAVKTSAGYRTYNPEKRRLTNCDSFVLDIGEDFFFVLPTNHVRPGDIILAGGIPRCVLKEEGDTITALNYEDATIETIIPERHIFFGNAYLYGKIVSIFGKNGVRGRKGAGRMMKYMMLSSMMKGKEGGMGSLLPLMLLGGKGGADDLFDFGGFDMDEADDAGGEGIDA